MRNEREANVMLSSNAAQVQHMRKALAAKREAKQPKSVYADGILAMLAKVLRKVH